MRYMVERNFVQVIGTIWMPATTCAMEYPLTAYDVGNIQDREEPGLTRRNVEDWLSCYSGDFRHVQDFRASIGDWESPWSSEESECTYGDCMYSCED